jgi:demethylmenaquinone methyltransferase/2-methoxy-6-polyprenyl-1,4-benzoquinol methylase
MGLSWKERDRVIQHVPDRDVVRHAYDIWSRFYDALAGPWEHGARMQALEWVIGTDRRILDVGIGPGAYFGAMAARAPAGALVCGVDLSSGMVHRARQRLRRQRTPASVIEADALTLPFADGAFDVVASSYLLDLLPLEAITSALTEFWRVLRPTGRLVLVNLTKEPGAAIRWYERCYRALPAPAKAYVLGGCRPVRLAHLVTAAGFDPPRRLVVRDALPSEIIVTRKTATDAAA